MNRRFGLLAVVALLAGAVGGHYRIVAEGGKEYRQSLSFSAWMSFGQVSPWWYGVYVDPAAGHGGEGARWSEGVPTFVEIPWRFEGEKESREAVLQYLRAGAEVCVSFQAEGEGDAPKILEVARSFPEVRFFCVGGLTVAETVSVGERIRAANPGSTVLMAIPSSAEWEATLEALCASGSTLGAALPGGGCENVGVTRMQGRLAELVRDYKRGRIPSLVSRWPAPGQWEGRGLVLFLWELAASLRSAVSVDLTGCPYADQARRSLVLLGREARCYGELLARTDWDTPGGVVVGEPFRVAMLLLAQDPHDAGFDIAASLENGWWSRRAWVLPPEEPVAPVWETSVQSDGRRPLSLAYKVASGTGRVVVLRNDLCWAYRQMRSVIALIGANLKGDRAGLDSLIGARKAVERAIVEWRGGAAHQAGLIHEALARIEEAGVLIGPVGAGALGELSADMAAETERALGSFHEALSQASADYLGVSLGLTERAAGEGVEVEARMSNGGVAGLDEVSLSMEGPVGWRVQAKGQASPRRLRPGEGLRATFVVKPKESAGAPGIATVRLQYRVRQGRALIVREVALRATPPAAPSKP